MTTRIQRKAASLASRQEKVRRLSRFHTFIGGILLQAVANQKYNGEYHDEFLLPKELDVNLTARQISDRFGHQCRDIFTRLFIRWQTKWKDRPAAWKVNPDLAEVYGRWMQHNLEATPAEALAFLKPISEELRVVKDYTTRERLLMSKEEHKAWLDEQQRAIRQAWSAHIFREDREKEEALR